MKGIISNVTSAIDVVARNRYRESATACGVRRKKASDGMIRLVSLLLLSFLMSFVGNSTVLADDVIYPATVVSQNYESFTAGSVTTEQIGWNFQNKNGASNPSATIVQGTGENTSKYLNIYYNDGGANRNQSWTFGMNDKILCEDHWTLSFAAMMNSANSSPYEF